MFCNGCLDLSAIILTGNISIRCSITFGSTSSQRPSSFFLALLSWLTIIQKYDRLRVRMSFTFGPTDMLLSRHTGFSFVRAVHSALFNS